MVSQYCVILAGGVGRRFWPYSTTERPKQFLDFFEHDESLLQMTYRRFRTLFEPQHIIVVSNRDYRDLVMQQLPELPEQCLLLEPNHRNTGAAITYAALHLHAVDPDCTIVVAPSDHLVRDTQSFLCCISGALQRAASSANIITLGIQPLYPETGYGYIQAIDPDDPEAALVGGRFYPVKTFTEKPNKYMSKVLVESGEFFWNSGLFIASASCFIREIAEHMPEIYERLHGQPDVWGTPSEGAYVDEQYPYCPNIPFDYGVMEKAGNIEMMLCDCGWADLGTWNSVYTLAAKDDDDNAMVGRADRVFNDSTGNLVVTDQSSGVIVLQGVSDLLVVRHGDIFLICPRSDQDKLKQVVHQVHATETSTDK